MPVFTLIEAVNMERAETQKAAEEREKIKIELRAEREEATAAIATAEISALRAELETLRCLWHPAERRDV